MSQYFDLMQRIEREQPFASSTVAAPAFPEVEGTLNGKATARWASDESLRLVQQIFLQPSEEPSRAVVFAGVEHGAGCSRISAAVAETLALNARKPVCLIEANFRRPGLASLFGAVNHHGLMEALIGDAPITAYAQPVASENLWLISAGNLTATSPSMITTEHLTARFKELRNVFEYVIVDAPPLHPYADAVVLGQLADGVVLVLEAESTRKDDASTVASTLRSAQVPILAAVLNKRTYPIPENIFKHL